MLGVALGGGAMVGGEAMEGGGAMVGGEAMEVGGTMEGALGGAGGAGSRVNSMPAQNAF